jgi:hypothetical protein
MKARNNPVSKRAMPNETKPCVECGRPFANRKSWRMRGQWESVIYCSEKCKSEAKRKRAIAN